MLKVELPEAFQFLFRPARYKVAWGGRGSGKSWSFARALILSAYAKPVRVLCAREIQNSIAESVHHLLANQIELMGFSSWFDVKEKTITSSAGASFIFAGLRSNVTKIKSMEGLTHVWVEEAENISSNSWEKLIPTLRTPGSEIWVTFNPDQATDPTYQRFIPVDNRPVDARVQKVSWRDNANFPIELAKERDYLARVDPDAYAHVWEGECRTVTDAQVLKGKYRIEAFEPQQGWHGPYYGADWGFSVDPTALLRMWVTGRTLYVEHEAYGVGVEIDNLPALFDKVPEARKHVVRADNARPETISYLQRHGYPRVTAAAKWSGSVEDGVEHLRSYEKIIIHPRCAHTIIEARLWSYKVDKLTGDVLPVLVEKHDHCIAAGELVCTSMGLKPIEQIKPGELVATRDGYRRVSAAWQASPSRRIFELKAANRTLQATPDHEIYVVGRGFVRMDAIRYADEVLITEESACEPRHVDTATEFGGAIPNRAAGQTGFTSGDHGETRHRLSFFTARCGKIISGQFRKGITSITRMAIREIIGSRIWSALSLRRTCLSISMMPGVLASTDISTTSGRWPANGINQRRHRNFTGVSVPWDERHSFLAKLRASSAVASSLLAKRLIWTDFVPTNARPHGVEQPDSITSRDNAQSAERDSCAPSMRIPRLVRVRVETVTDTGIDRPVYDLAVEGQHEFIASGFLVSNCWDASRYGLEPMIKRRTAKFTPA